MTVRYNYTALVNFIVVRIHIHFIAWALQLQIRSASTRIIYCQIMWTTHSLTHGFSSFVISQLSLNNMQNLLTSLSVSTEAAIIFTSVPNQVLLILNRWMFLSLILLGNPGNTSHKMKSYSNLKSCTHATIQ